MNARRGRIVPALAFAAGTVVAGAVAFAAAEASPPQAEAGRYWSMPPAAGRVRAVECGAARDDRVCSCRARSGGIPCSPGECVSCTFLEVNCFGDQ